MEQGLGQDSVPASGPLDKSRVLDVKPLRRLVPVFPSPQDMPSFPTPRAAAPFVCVPPSGPFPPGFAPFYPFSPSVESQRQPEQNGPTGFGNPITDAVPLTSFRTPSTAGGGSRAQVNGDTGPSRTRSRFQQQSQSGFAEEDVYSQDSFSMHGTDADDTDNTRRAKKKALKRTRASREANLSLPDIDIDAIVNDYLSSFNKEELQADGDRKSVVRILMIFDLLRRKLAQGEDSKEATPGVTRRPDLRVGTILMNKGIRTNVTKKIGAAPGVEVGDIFFFRMEMCVIGLHQPTMAGIAYMGLKINQEEEPLAVSIVSSGGYEDDVQDANVLIYSGQGGNVYNGRDKKVTDQKLERGNLALEKSLHRGNEVRVIRGLKDVANPTGKVYVYDGLYKIQESWVEKGKSGYNVFKYKLVRLPGQPEAFMTWKLVQLWKEGIISSRVGVILPDLTSGAESIPVSLVNDVDNERGPAHFTYSPTLKYSKPVTSIQSCGGCSCGGGCLPGNPNCSCIQKNGGYLPYTTFGVVVSPNSLTHECGLSCLCPPNCRNRVSQGGLKFHLEVFRTKDRGWGLRSWDPIRAGAFVCEYAGEVIDRSKIEELGGDNEDDYVFDSSRTYQPLESLPGVSNEAPKLPFPLMITAKSVGNVARFMNHSCHPNLFWQPVLRESNNGCDLHIAFHAMKHIPPMTELTYDYGTVAPDKAERRKKCLCGSPNCRGYF